jgi:hypothetical protein
MRRFILIALVALITTAIQAQVPSHVPTNGLVGWWPFNGNANDASGNGNNGAVNGAPLAEDRFGSANRAYALDGVNDFISVQHSSSFVLNNQFTVSIWFKPVTTQNSVLIEKFTATGNYGDGGFQIALRTNDYVDFNVVHNDADNFVYSNSQSSVNQWQQVLAAWDGSEIRLYQNGVEVEVAPFTATLNDCLEPLSIGHRAFPNDLHFNGSIDDIGIWNRALTPAEIQALYDAQSSPCVSPETVTFSGLNSGYLTSDAPTTLSGTPAGGVFIGPGINGSAFSPASAGEGNHSISYTYLDENNCVNTFSLCTSVALGMGVEPGVNALGGVRVFPNPNKGRFTVELELSGLVSMQVFDARGALVHSEVFNASGIRTQHMLELRDTARGRYTLQVQNAGSVATQQLIID